MTKRTNKKLDLLERHEKLTPEVRNRLEQKKKILEKDLAFIDGLLKKPTLDVEKKEPEKKRKELK